MFNKMVILPINDINIEIKILLHPAQESTLQKFLDINGKFNSRQQQTDY
jgi:hypothetical protein